MSTESCQNKRDVFLRANNGEDKAVQEVLRMFTPMVHMWAKNYSFMCPTMYEDLVQDGILGIVESIRSFNPDLKSSKGKPLSPSTWVWWKTRQAVQSAARKYKGSPKVSVIKDVVIDQVADSSESGGVSNFITTPVEKILEEGCSSLNGFKAQIVMERFGLRGAAPLSQSEIAKKHGISRQVISKHLSKFYTAIRTKYPELKSLIN